tara:strand:- start:360 stop:659 length:300 start_codon:yes stop_codon:yes gene_type:complete
MAKVILRQKAIDDLNEIWHYTRVEWSESQADRYYAMLKIACEGIGDNPDIGKQYFPISKDLLGLKSGKHILFYQQISSQRIEILRILHERMDLKNRIIE